MSKPSLFFLLACYTLFFYGLFMLGQYAFETHESADVLNERFRRNPKGWPVWLGEQFELQPDMDILALGYCDGVLWKKVCDRMPRGCRLVLADSSEEMSGLARADLSDAGVEVCFDRVDMQSLPYEAEQFDVVVANNIYEADNPGEMLAQIARVLRRSGVLYAAAVGDTHQRELYRIAQRFSRGRWRESITESFRLENGSEFLESHFSRCSVKRYDDELVVSEVQPLVSYIKSLPGILLEDESEDALRRYLEREIQTLGHILITRDAGVFVARK